LLASLADLFTTLPAAWVAVVFIASLLVGSFLNVVIHRVPVMLEREWRTQAEEILREKQSAAAQPKYNLVVPRSACPKCGAMITAAQNVPLLSYLWLKGKCASCGARISLRYPFVELGTAILSALFLTAALPPIALFFAILRYRLYDIDTIISRAVVYGALVAVLGGVYAASMGIINKLFLEVFGEPTDAAVVLETLILVTISAPLKPWLDKVVERRFGLAPKPHDESHLLDDPAFSAALDARVADAVARATRSGEARPQPPA